MRFLDTILNLIFPINCISCGLEGVDLCARCVSESPAAERESEKWIFPVFDYRHPPIKRAIWVLKYKGRRRLARVFAESMYGRIVEELSELYLMENFREPLLIPIPLSGKRIRERGYNQAELICEELIKLDNNSINFNLEKNVLIKTGDVKHQARIENRRERLKNIIGSFAVGGTENVRGRNIILIDDVTTTGATLSEAKKTLKRSGAGKIIAFTVAH